jgi:hypothetical protein
MKYFISSFIFILSFISSQASPQWQWSNIASASHWAMVRAICVDKLGNVYVAGNYHVPILIEPFISRIFIAKYSASGTLSWLNATGGGIPNRFAQVTGPFLRDIAVNNQGNVFSTGEFANTDIRLGNLSPLPLSEPKGVQQISYWAGKLFETFP